VSDQGWLSTGFHETTLEMSVSDWSLLSINSYNNKKVNIKRKRLLLNVIVLKKKLKNIIFKYF
jgi:hypothetical protein